jgi:hypothetical protein
MTLKNYVKELKAFIKKYPEAMDMQIVTAIDDEGNSYVPVVFGPSRGEYNKETHQFEICRTPENYNAVCLN